MTIYKGNIISSGVSQGRVEIDITNTEPDADGNLTVNYAYRLWSRYSISDNTNQFYWHNPSDSGTTNYNVSMSSGGTIIWRSGSFRYNVGYGGGSVYFTASITRLEAFGVNNVTSVSVNHPLPARPSSVPSAPGKPELSAITSRSANLGWAGSALDNGSPIDAYLLRIYDGTSETSYWDHSSANNTARTVSGLTRATIYTAAVYAHNGVGYSPRSERLTFRTPAEKASAPATPQLVSVTATSITIKINPTSDDGGSPITGYLLRRFIGSTPSGPYIDVSQDLTMERVVSGLTPGVVYTFYVFAYGEAGYSAPSGTLTVQTLSGTRVNVAGQWKIVVPYVKVAGVWKNATPYVKVGGVWKISS